MGKPILCLDFDGVIHSYTSGWKRIDIIPDPPVPGAFDWIRRAAEHFRVVIYSSRSKMPIGIHAMRAWFEEHDDPNQAWPITNILEFASEKPAAFLTIDDRAITFTGVWPDIDLLKSFQPWNKQPAPQPREIERHDDFVARLEAATSQEEIDLIGHERKFFLADDLRLSWNETTVSLVSKNGTLMVTATRPVTPHRLVSMRDTIARAALQRV